MELVLVALSTVLAIVPMVFFLAVVWLSDRYDREPLWLVVLTFLWGAIGAVFIALPLNTGFQMLVSGVIAPVSGDASGFLEHFLGPAVGAPLFEEPAKAMFLLFVAWNRRPPDMSSGFVYGAAAGLGFAMTENFMYFSSVAGDLATFASTVAIRTFYCAALHAMASSVVGAAFGFGRLRSWPVWIVSTGLGLAAAMVLHALWNGPLALDDFSAADLTTLVFFMLPVEVLFVLFIWQLCLFDDALSIRRELQEEEDAGLLPRDQSWKIASWWRRLFVAAGPPGVDPHRFVRTATALARRKRQLALLGTRAPDFYRDDVRRLRRQLQMILAAAPTSG
ncbi:MAG: PrsW family intramembrane metalloprotease [Myxococcales bacterium]|nr:PrsW family intramembrane metalloprotease [Myxococcales bacterium]MCB9668178.1 PrsW family intramembrane metalloprotease [Alphaproteobacteria bacterium]MCB9692517.1 PrsW family intramembrane metalloprotease [Alphaproteobacteria bacterium]